MVQNNRQHRKQKSLATIHARIQSNYSESEDVDNGDAGSAVSASMPSTSPKAGKKGSLLNRRGRNRFVLNNASAPAPARQEGSRKEIASVTPKSLRQRFKLPDADVNSQSNAEVKQRDASTVDKGPTTPEATHRATPPRLQSAMKRAVLSMKKTSKTGVRVRQPLPLFKMSAACCYLQNCILCFSFLKEESSVHMHTRTQ